jgi:hypothetical protein
VIGFDHPDYHTVRRTATPEYAVELPLLPALPIGWLGVPLTFFWLAGLTNAYNFMDGMDGFAGGMAVIGFCALAWLGRADAGFAAVCLTDVFDDGLSMVYSFYDPDLSDLSLGTHVILDHIDIAREAGLPYVYLGYWVPGSRKMGYKATFPALEIYKGGRWQDIGNPSEHRAELHPLSVDPIAEQVARISLPDTRVPRDV